MKKALVLGSLATLAAMAIWIARTPDKDRLARSNRRRRVARMP